MLSFAGSLKIFVALEACDMRKGFNGLYAQVTERLEEDPKQGSLFVFTNRRRNRLKILFCNRLFTADRAGELSWHGAMRWIRGVSFLCAEPWPRY